MKLMQMLKLTKLRKFLSRTPKPEPITEYLFGLVKSPSEFESNEEFCEELFRKDRVGDALSLIMTDYREENGPMNPIPSFKGVGVSHGQLSTYPPTQVRNIKKCFARSFEDRFGWRNWYSDQTLESLLVERGCDTVQGSLCRKASSTVLITKRAEYKRKVNDKYQTSEVVCADSPTS